MTAQALTELFTQKAQLVSAIVAHAKTFDEALAYAVDICDRKQACQLLVSGCELPVSDSAQALCDTKQQKVVAAPGLHAKHFSALKKLCKSKALACVDSNLRDHVAGIDVGIAVAGRGIAETGTCVVVSDSEDVRLSSMLCEVQVIILPTSALAKTAFDIEAWMEGLMAAPPSYLAFITGASRTADIERVLAIGVHGPLELHIVLMEEAAHA